MLPNSADQCSPENFSVCNLAEQLHQFFRSGWNGGQLILLAERLQSGSHFCQLRKAVTPARSFQLVGDHFELVNVSIFQMSLNLLATIRDYYQELVQDRLEVCVIGIDGIETG